MRLISLKLRKQKKSTVVVEDKMPKESRINQDKQQCSNQPKPLKSNGPQSEAKPEEQEVRDLWIFPPPRPVQNFCNEVSVQNTSTAVATFQRRDSLRRTLSIRIKRIIHPKPIESYTPIIPAELKPQLRNIYVY